MFYHELLNLLEFNVTYLYIINIQIFKFYIFFCSFLRQISLTIINIQFISNFI